MRASYINELNEWASEFKFSVSVSVRFSETDMYGHLNNTVTFAYYEYARIEYLKQIGLMNDWLDPNGVTIPVVADLQCDYLKQVFFDEALDIYVKAASVGNSSVDIHYMAKNAKDEIVFTGRGTLVQISKETGRGIVWTEKEKSLFVGESIK
ncbi:acyl-CoA thioesterase [Sporosarcina siberiensis]|uniref:Acyl-CoA thioesterase n=1 Tax=Sporosarcina siberiensis TaxID=1365606 RepID=A0ABW4SCQ7_9BACL